MKAAIYRGIEDMVVEEIAIPKVPADGYLIKIMACGICGSDLRTYYSGTSYIKPPIIIGHEIAGKIVETGPEAEAGFKVGDRVAVAPPVHCDHCHYCRQGKQNLCLNTEAIPSPRYPGGFAQYMTVDGYFARQGAFARIPDNLSYNEAGIAELASSVIRCHEHYNTNVNDTVVIFGSGPIGCLHAQLSCLRGAKLIIQSDILDSRLGMAKPFGADILVNNAKENLKEIVKRETEGLGATMAIVAAPNPAAAPEALDVMASGGQLVIFAGFSANNSTLQLDGNRIHYGEVSVVGTAGFTKRHHLLALELASKGRLNLADLITSTVSLDNIVAGIQSVKQGKDLKVVVKPWQEGE